MKGLMNTQLGAIMIDPEVIARYAGSVAVECFGIVGMAMVNMKDGIVKLLRGDNLTRGVNVQINDNKITLSFHVIVAYGVSISAVSDNLISNVKYKVEASSYTNLALLTSLRGVSFGGGGMCSGCGAYVGW